MQAPGYSAALFKLTVTGLFANNYHQAGSRQSSNAPDSCWNLPGRHSGNFLEDMIRNLFSLIFRCTCTYMCVFQLIIYIYYIQIDFIGCQMVSGVLKGHCGDCDAKSSLTGLCVGIPQSGIRNCGDNYHWWSLWKCDPPTLS